MNRCRAPQLPTQRVPHEIAATPGAWVDTTLGASHRAERLWFDQPESGLLWILSGELHLEAHGRNHRVGKGDVVAYRLGDSLRWSASEGIRARWSAREVNLDVGGAQPWTASNAIELPATDTAIRRRRRAMRLVLVLWCALGLAVLAAIARHFAS